MICHIDFETYSPVDIGSCGSFKYQEHPEFEIILIGYAFDDEPVKVVDRLAGEPWPEELLDALRDPAVIKSAHNCAFERGCINRELGFYTPPEEWQDTMIMAATCGLPLSLDSVGKALNLSEEQAKMKEGKALIRYFCCPCKPTKANGQRTRNYPEHAPEKWEVFKQYNKRDVETERTIYHLLERWIPDEREHALFCLDARINEHGMNTDQELARNAMQMDARFKEELTAKAIEMTGLDNPNSTAQVKEWLESQEGITVPSLNKKAVADVVAQLSTDKCREFMTLRAELSKSSTKKYESITRTAGADGHIRGCFQFYGAHTGRWCGRLCQLQNLPQNHMPDLDSARELVKADDYETLKVLYGNVSSTLSELVRTALIPEEGCKFIVADYSAIEARVLSWVARQEWRLEVFRNGGDIYCASASQMFKVPVVKNGINGHLRARGKTAELALGYGGGINALKAFGADKLGMTEEEMGETVAKWREASPNIVALWSRLERAAARCIVHGTTQFVDMISFHMDKNIMWMRLPSGRSMAYYNPKYEPGTGKYDSNRNVVSFMVQNQVTKKWERISTFGGRLTENAIQAIARDCLAETLLRLEAEGYDVRAHVHDEVIVSEPKNGRGVKDVCDIFARPIPWAPGLPLVGAGYEGNYYFKD